jgi:hypothetical protein
MNVTEKIRDAARDVWIPTVYEEKIRPERTRSITLDIPKKENLPKILHTLLGIELQTGKVRIACPDLSTARYIRVFVRICVSEFSIPYDITILSAIADELEADWHKTLLYTKEFTKGETPQSAGKTRAAIIREMRHEIEKIGAGEKMPLFNKPTKQRNAS